MTSPRHPRSPLPPALRWAAAALFGLAAAAAAQSPPQEAPPALELVVAWTAQLPAPPAAEPARDAERLYVALRPSGVAAVALDSGTLAWTADTATEARVAAGGGLVYVAAGDSLAGLDAATGVERWRGALPAPASAPPAWNNGWLLVGGPEGRLAMLRADRGVTIWARDLGAGLRPGATMTGDRVYVLLDDRRVAALGLQSGATLWEREIEGNATAITALDDRLFVGADDRSLYCLSAADGKVKWRFRVGGEVLGSPAVDMESVYFVSLDNVLRALNRGNGHQRWKRGLSFRPVGGPILAGDLLLVPGLAAEIAAFRAPDGAAAGAIAVGEEPSAAPLLLPAEGAGPPSLVVIAGASVERLGPAPPPLESHPVPGLPPFLEIR